MRIVVGTLGDGANPNWAVTIRYIIGSGVIFGMTWCNTLTVCGGVESPFALSRAIFLNYQRVGFHRNDGWRPHGYRT